MKTEVSRLDGAVVKVVAMKDTLAKIDVFVNSNSPNMLYVIFTFETNDGSTLEQVVVHNGEWTIGYEGVQCTSKS